MKLVVASPTGRTDVSAEGGSDYVVSHKNDYVVSHKNVRSILHKEGRPGATWALVSPAILSEINLYVDALAGARK